MSVNAENRVIKSYNLSYEHSHKHMYQNIIVGSVEISGIFMSRHNFTQTFRMSNVYRIYPTLWNDGICQMAQTVYAADRQPPPNTFATTCSRRTEKDPAYYWENPTFQRLCTPPNTTGTCCQPAVLNSVTWPILPAWLSYVQSLGYTVTSDLSLLKPFSDIYISGP